MASGFTNQPFHSGVSSLAITVQLEQPHDRLPRLQTARFVGVRRRQRDAAPLGYEFRRAAVKHRESSRLTRPPNRTRRRSRFWEIPPGGRVLSLGWWRDRLQ